MGKGQEEREEGGVASWLLAGIYAPGDEYCIT